MADRMRQGSGVGGRAGNRRALRPATEALEDRRVPAASLAPIAGLSVPATVGYQLPLDGSGATGPQTYTVTSSNPSVGATIAQGKFLTVGVSHASSGAVDPSFTGTLTYQLFDDLTPLTTSKIEQLVNQGFYTSPTTGNNPSTGQPYPSKNFHRVVPGFVAQAGSQTGNGAGSLNQAGFPFADEYNQQLVYNGTGQLAMANAGNDTNDSQFFTTLAATRSLDFNKTLFGQLVAGQATLNNIAGVARTSGSNSGEGSMPTSPVLITSTTLSTTNPNGVVHVDATRAAAGQTADLTITATDAATGQRTSRVVPVSVVANTTNEQPFLGPVQNQVVGQVNATTPQQAIFQLNSTDAQLGEAVVYQVGASGPSGTATTFTAIPASQGTAAVDASGVVTVTPAAGFTGVIPLLVGVRNNTAHSGTSVTALANYDTQRVSVTVVNGTVVNLRPLATPGTAQVTANTPATVALAGRTANPQSAGQTLTYALTTQPQHGTVSNFNASTGTFTYTPTAGFLGNDSVRFTTTDVGAPSPNLTSLAATETLVVGGGQTGAVRVIDNVLIVTPLPRTDGGTNTIAVNVVNGNVVATINGVPDANQPALVSLDQLVIYGSKASDNVTVDPAVTVPTTIDGGQGGNNSLQTGAGDSILHGLTGNNTLAGGAGNDILIGRPGHTTFKSSAGTDILYTSQKVKRSNAHGIHFPGLSLRASTRKNLGVPPQGTYYRFVGGKLVKTKVHFFPTQRVKPTPAGKVAPTSAGLVPGAVATGGLGTAGKGPSGSSQR